LNNIAEGVASNFEKLPNQPSECTDEIVVNLIEKLGVNITSGDISISHRLAPPSKKVLQSYHHCVIEQSKVERQHIQQEDETEEC